MPAEATLALGLVDARHLDPLLGDGPPSLDVCAEVLGWPDHLPRGSHPIDRLRFGPEFCETLLPSEAQLHLAHRLAAAAGLELTLVLPPLSDAGIAALPGLLSRLPDGAEVVVNDWGAARLARRLRPELPLTAGRLLCKMIKDPRLPGEEWSRLYPHGIGSAGFAAVLARAGIGRVEMDAPPFARPDDFRASGLPVGVHAGAGFSVKGRSCRTGSLHLDPADKFATGQDCRRECLTYVDSFARPAAGPDEPRTFQRGNTLFYAHGPEVRAAVDEAVAQGLVDRLIVTGDWNENSRAP